MQNLRIKSREDNNLIAYGRGAKAIALAAKEEGIEITDQEAQAIITAIFTMYPGLLPFFDEYKRRAVSRTKQPAPRWICGALGRYRRFATTDEDKVKGDIERQAQNFPMQNLIADVVSLAVAELYNYPRDEVDFALCLQVHDAVISIVRDDCVARYVDEVLPACMVDAVPIYPTYADGSPQGTGPYYLSISTELCTHWGVTPLPDLLAKRGIPAKYAGWHEHAGGLVHPEAYPNKVWKNAMLQEL